MSRVSLKLVPIDESGRAAGFNGDLPASALAALEMTKALYRTIGYVEPWVSYFAVAGGQVVGCCSFKSAPVKGRVEIAYFTFAEYEGRGIGTSMAAELIAIARADNESILIAAQTLPERNASHRILEKLGFGQAGTIHHPEDGVVLEWQLRASACAPR